jgi:glycosyltransferase involved in cell wall biosynthesis
LRRSARVVNRAILTHAPNRTDRPRGSNLVFTSPLEGRKAPRLALHALAYSADDVRLVFINDGPEEGKLKSLAQDLGLQHRVEFRGRIPRQEMFDVVAEAAACVHTGLREVGGCALAEAMMTGSPVIVLGWDGARQIAEAATDQSRVAIIEPGWPDETARRLGAAMTRFVRESPEATSPYLDQATTARALQQAIIDAAATHRKRSDA